MKHICRNFIIGLTCTSCLNFFAQNKNIRFRGWKYTFDDSGEVCLQKIRGLVFSGGEYYKRHDREQSNPVPSDTCIYLSCGVKEFFHTKAFYIYLDRSGKVVALEKIRVRRKLFDKKEYIITFVHHHRIRFFTNSVNGVRIRLKKFRYKEIREAGCPPSYG